MKEILSNIKSFLKRSKTLVALNGSLRWKIHLLKDWWGTRVWTKTTEVMTPLGFKLTSGFHPAYELMRTGEFEVEETAIIKKILPQVDLFVDIGANLGYYSCLALKNEKHVIAFEPQQQNLKCLFQNITVNGWDDEAEVFPLALSDKPGLLTLFGASGPSASLVKNWAGYSSHYKKIVPVSTLDNILAGRFQDDNIFVKIDVEGAELSVLKGAVTTLARDLKPSWLVEICLEEFHPDGHNPDFKEIFQLFWDNGYLAFTATNSPALVTPASVNSWVENNHTDLETFNYVFVESESILQD